ncbi:C45 family autoproteolytic acyltransferase/hydrolase [Embleya sp. NPDC008237]|uniref:C45 family autoproteolytic acyltransferase/hydolase n=1 Tax=Embleya sp. NPDC008237 TaxID=3363978 RepID=UPI0036E45A25
MTAAPSPHPEPRTRLHITTAGDPRTRGIARGQALRAGIHGAIETYDRLFALGGITPELVHDHADRALDTIDGFRPGARAEIEGIAAGAHVPTWRIAALNARTEILAHSTTVPPGECTTVVRRFDRAVASAAPTFGIQTWDWHVELADHWHTFAARGGRHDVVGLTEHGILGKIGINSAGLALHFNILGHVRDGVGGIPMHVLAAIVLEEAADVTEALEIVRSAPIASSGSFALFDPSRAVLLDLSPAGVFEIEPENGVLLRTNHFLTPIPAANEKTWLYQPDSTERRDFVQARLARRGAPNTPDELVDLLVTGAGEPPVTCVADPDKPLGQRWATLATVILEPATRTATILDGTPADAASGTWRSLTA